MLLFKWADQDDFRQRPSAWLETVQTIFDNPDNVEALLRYLMQVAAGPPPGSLQPQLRHHLTPRVAETLMTWAGQLKQQSVERLLLLRVNITSSTTRPLPTEDGRRPRRPDDAQHARHHCRVRARPSSRTPEMDSRPLGDRGRSSDTRCSTPRCTRSSSTCEPSTAPPRDHPRNVSRSTVGRVLRHTSPILSALIGTEDRISDAAAPASLQQHARLSYQSQRPPAEPVACDLPPQRGL